MVAEQFDRLVEQSGFVDLAGASMAPTQPGEDFLTGDVTHVGVHGFGNTHF